MTTQRRLHVLFVCSQNRLRSPTAEQVFAKHPALECSSAGTNREADNPLSPELVAWSDVVFVMEGMHRRKLQSRFRQHLKARGICLGIPDDYDDMDPALVSLLRLKVERHLPPWTPPDAAS